MIIKGIFFVFMLMNCVYSVWTRDQKERLIGAMENHKEFSLISDAMNALTDQMKERNDKLDKMIEIQNTNSKVIYELANAFKEISSVASPVKKMLNYEICRRKNKDLFGTTCASENL